MNPKPSREETLFFAAAGMNTPEERAGGMRRVLASVGAAAQQEKCHVLKLNERQVTRLWDTPAKAVFAVTENGLFRSELFSMKLLEAASSRRQARLHVGHTPPRNEKRLP